VTTRRTILLIAAVLPAALGLWWWLSPRPPARLPLPPSDDPRLTYDTPFRNVRPDVQYVGDETCAGCHAKEAQSYRQHPMGRSFFSMPSVVDEEQFGPEFKNPFTSFGTVYRTERRGDRVWHVATRPRPGGGNLFEMEAEAVYALGSRTRGRSYLVDHDGYLFQSPISWFSQKRRWDLSPGYGPMANFDRPILPGCLFCHCNAANPVENTLNRYREPIFRGHAIGCERCHGPGELHVQDPGRINGIDHSIVNPRHLDPPLREAVCEQCHLQGEARIARRGRGLFDYRPGLPLGLFLAVFVRQPDLTDRRKAVGHVEQMRASRCYQKSKGRLGCASCHDPHELPAPEKRVAFYRDRCLTCHGQPGEGPECSLPREERLVQQKDDSCIACHLPRVQSSDIAHTAVSDHRIPRHPPVKEPALLPRPLREGESPIVDFYRDPASPRDAETARDQGLALIELARGQVAVVGPLSQLALPLLEEAVPARPDDVPALEARAFALCQCGRGAAGRAAYEALLAKAPDREQSLADVAWVCMGLGDWDAAAGYWSRAVEVNPWNVRHRTAWAQVHLRRRDWAGAREQCQAALRLNPAMVEARLLLVQSLLGAGDKERAEKEFEDLLILQPDQEAELRRWFAEQAR
jgi:Tfp pilus assembly protein PilF